MKKRLKILSFKAVGTVIPHTLEDVQTTLSKMGHRVFVIDIPAIDSNHLKEIAIMDALVDVEPDMVITIDSVGLVPSQYLCLNPNMKVVSWFFDAPPPFLKDMDVSLFNSRYHLFSWDKAYEDVVKSLGVSRFYYLPFATNPEIYKAQKVEKKYDVSFVGTWSDKRAKVLLDLAERGIKIDLFGNNKWEEINHPNILFHGFADNRKECPEIYSASKINLNITNDQLLTSLPLRIFDVGACNSFLLTDDQDDARSIFQKDELIIYKNTDDLEEKILYYLANESERELISQKMYEHVNKDYTYEVQLSKMLEMLDQNIPTPADRRPQGEELMVILWKTSLSLMHFSKFNEALSLLQLAAQTKTTNTQKIFVNALTLAICLKLAGREKEAENIVNQNDVLKSSYTKLLSIQDYGKLRTALYFLKETSFRSGGDIENGTAKRVSAIS